MTATREIRKEPGMGGSLPAYRFTTRKSKMMAAWLVVIE
jgi:hypothetical protein